jgi:hypothetical protein
MDFPVAPQAESDLDEIGHFLATQSSNIDVADRVIDSIKVADFWAPPVSRYAARAVGSAAICYSAYYSSGALDANHSKRLHYSRCAWSADDRVVLQ